MCLAKSSGSLGFLNHFVPSALEPRAGFGAVLSSDGQKCWHFLQNLLDYEVDSDEEWEEEEPGESLSHSEEVRILHAENIRNHLHLAE